MTFALPIGLALAALALPIIAFYILKVRMRRIPVSTNLFWKQIFDEKPPRSLWQNFRHLLSLLMQLGLLALLVLAIADPYFPWQLLQARRIVVVMDDSASMRSDDIAPTRFEAAKREAIDVVHSLRFRDELAIVVAGKHPQVLVGMTNHAPTLRRALDELQVSDSSTDLQPAIELGKQLIGDHPHGQVLVFSDGCVEKVPLSSNQANSDSISANSPAAASVGQTKPSESKQPFASNESQATSKSVAPVVYKIFASNADNIGITQFQVRRSLIDPLGYEVLVAINNASQSQLRCRLELSLNDVPIDVLPIELKPNENWSRSIEKTSLDGGLLFAELTQIRDGNSKELASSGESIAASTTNRDTPVEPQLNRLKVDDSAWAILPARIKQKVLIVSKGNLFLQKVFQANPLVQVSLTKELPTAYPADHIVVFHGMVPEQLPSGNILVIDPLSSSELWQVGEPIENPIVTKQDTASPIMKHIRLDNVLMPQSRQLIFASPPHALASTVTNDIVLAEIRRPAGKCLVLGVNLDQSDLAFRTSFPILVTNALGWFAGQSGEIAQAYETGMSTVITLTPEQMSSAKEWSLLSPSNRLVPIKVTSEPLGAESLLESKQGSESSRESLQKTASEGRARTIPWNEVGLWNLVPRKENANVDDLKNQEPVMQFAVNLSNARESDLRPHPDLLNAQAPTSVLASWLSRPAWFYLVLAACLWTALEWFLYQRRLIT
jgi:hypothetical protein